MAIASGELGPLLGGVAAGGGIWHHHFLESGSIPSDCAVLLAVLPSTRPPGFLRCTNEPYGPGPGELCARPP